MASLSQHEAKLIFCSGSLVRVFDIGETGCVKYKCPVVPRNNEADNEGKQTMEPSLSDCILCSRFSPCGQYFAVCDDNKQLIIWNTGDTGTWTLHSARLLVRRCTSLVFTKAADALLVADKSGDVYKYSVANSEHGGELLMGHVSMLFDIVLAGDDKFIVTCDRDEKVRVTCYPNTHSIQSFCLGHTEFVSRLLYIEKCDKVISGSGDGKVCSWNYRTGSQSSCRNCHADLSLTDSEYADISQFSYCSSHNLLIVAFDRRPWLLVYNISDTGSLNLIQTLKCEAEVWDICVDNKHRLWVLLKQPSNLVQTFYLSSSPSLQFLPMSEDDSDVNNIRRELNMDETFFNASMDIECIFSTLHKAKHDNMKKYFELKQERISGKKSKCVEVDKQVVPSVACKDSEDELPEEKRVKLS